MIRNHRLIFDQLVEIAPESAPWIVDRIPVAVTPINDQVPLSEVAAAACRGATLFETTGVRPGDYVAVWMDGTLDVLIALAAITAVGGVPILISPTLPVETVVQMLEAVVVERVVTTAVRQAECHAAGTAWEVQDWAELVERSRALPPRRASAVAMPSTAPYVVTHTSGTTGVPKLVQYTRKAADNQSFYVQELPAILGRLRGYAAVAVSPVHFRTVTGILNVLRRNLPLVVLNDHSPESVARFVRRWQPILLEAHPNTYMRWEELADSGAFGSVRYFVSTFDVIHPGTVRRLLAGSRYRFAAHIESYGQSEVGAIAAKVHFKGLIGRGARSVRRSLNGHSTGWVAIGYSQARIVGENGLTVPAGTPGRIHVRSKGQFTTYINRQQEADANRDADGWWDTGDFGMRTRFSRRLILMDRRIERMVSIPSAIALEDVLLSRMPWLLEVVVLERDQRLRPVVSVRGKDFDDRAWAATVRDLPRMEPPIVLAIDEIPRTATGKVQRSTLVRTVFGTDV